MFKVQDKEGNIYTIYDARAVVPKSFQTNIAMATEFLIFNELTNKWDWIDSKNFIPFPLMKSKEELLEKAFELACVAVAEDVVRTMETKDPDIKEISKSWMRFFITEAKTKKVME